LEVFEDQQDGAALGQPLEEQPPRPEQVVAGPDGRLLQPQQVREAGFDPSPLLGIGYPPLDGLLELACGVVVGVVGRAVALAVEMV